MFGTAIETIVWSMKVIATAKIIAANTQLRPCSPLPLMRPPRSAGCDPTGRGYARLRRMPCRRPHYASPESARLQGLELSKGALVDEDIAALMRRAWAAYDRGDEDGFAACLTDD